MPDYQQFKIPVFPNINDRPTVPTAQTPGNGSDLIARHNALVNALNADLKKMEEALEIIERSLFDVILIYGLS